MNLMPLAQRLESDALGLIAKSIFVNMMPFSCPEGILLKNKLQGTEIDYELPKYFRTGFQVITRSANYQTAEAMMENVFASLTMVEETLGTVHYIYCRPITQPIAFPLSEGNLIEFSTHFDVACYEVT